jgi:putative acetyltransferase
LSPEEQTLVQITIRPETAADIPATRRVNELAFGSASEANLVDALREKAHPHISLVAVVEDQVVGHIFFSPVSIESGPANAMGLAPMAVLPEYQKQGIGSLLVRHGLVEAHRAGFDIVVVLGHPQYYPRFGFFPASQKELRCEYPVPDEVFMVIELEPGALNGKQGLVKYHPEFAQV